MRRMLSLIASDSTYEEGAIRLIGELLYPRYPAKKPPSSKGCVRQIAEMDDVRSREFVVFEFVAGYDLKLRSYVFHDVFEH